jgi:peptide/nickel transport system substrate-binding protein
MDRQLTAKDIALFTGIALVALLVLLAMYQVDRQWQKMEEIQRSLTEQGEDLRDLRGTVRGVEQRLKDAPPALASQAATAQPRTPAQQSTEIPGAFRRAHAATQRSDYAEGDWLVNAFATGLKTITPLASSDAYASDVQSYVLESLLSRDPDTLEWQGLIARDWQVSEDGLTFTFHLRDDVKFSDGKPLTADDVAFTYDFIMNPKIAAPRERAYYEKLASVRANGPLEVVFVYKEPYYNALDLAGGLAIMPRHFYEPYLNDPDTFNQSKGLLLGSGPYRLKDPKGWTPDTGIVELERNPRYWGPVRPSFERLLWRIIGNDSARLTTYRNRDIDAYGARPVEYKKLLDDGALMARSQHFEYMSPTAGYNYIGWNQQRDGKPSRFADARVRQAMTYLTDRQRIVDEIFLGYGEPAVSPFSPRSKQHDTSLDPHPFDVTKAQALLKEAGYEDRNGDGVLEGPNDTPFSFDLVYFQDSEDTKRMVLLLKDLYARAGIELKPKPSEWAVMLDLINRRDFDAITLGWTSGIETDIYQIFHSSQTVTGGDNFVNYVNPELDQLIDTARATVDESKRMPLWQRCEQILFADQPYTFLTRRKSLVFIDQRLHNVAMTGLGLNFGSVPLELYVPRALQKYTQ